MTKLYNISNSQVFDSAQLRITKSQAVKEKIKAFKVSNYVIIWMYQRSLF
jgi:hypothetical protein